MGEKHWNSSYRSECQREDFGLIQLRVMDIGILVNEVLNLPLSIMGSSLPPK